MAFVETSVGKIYYEVHGKGETIVLLRGLGRWSEHWCGWYKNLAQHYQVIIFDGRGLGRSTIPIKPWHRMSDLASDVKAILDQEQIAAAHLFGVSLGGMIALQFALDYPSVAKSVTAVNSSIGRSGFLRMTVKAASVVLSAPARQPDFYLKLAKVLLSSEAQKEHILSLATAWENIDARYPKPFTTVGAQLAIAMRWRHWENLSKITCPVNIVVGLKDQFVPIGNSLFIHKKIPHSTLTQVSDAGHELHMEIAWRHSSNSIFMSENFYRL